jgi:hypothetical protein
MRLTLIMKKKKGEKRRQTINASRHTDFLAVYEEGHVFETMG